MKITDIRCAGLRGATPEGGWSNELRPEDCVHTLIAVHTDEGHIGLGSVFTNDNLVRAAIAVLQPLFVGECALEPERVSEKLHQHMFWLGRGDRSLMRSAESISRYGICSARRLVSQLEGCWEVAIESACSRMRLC